MVRPTPLAAWAGCLEREKQAVDVSRLRACLGSESGRQQEIIRRRLRKNFLPQAGYNHKRAVAHPPPGKTEDACA